MYSIPDEPFEKFPMLEVDDLILCEITMDDLDDIEELAYYNSVKTKTREETIDSIRKVAEDYRNRKTLHWGIVKREGSDRSILGACGFYRGFKDGVAEVGYVLKEAHRGKGIITKVVKRLSEYGFEVLKLNAIKAYTKETNLASVNVLKRAGYTQVESDLEGFVQFVLNAPR